MTNRSLSDRTKQQYAEQFLFFTGHALVLLGGLVDRRNIYRWINEGRIKAHQLPSRAWMFDLDEINRLRSEYLLPEYSKEKAQEIWERADLSF